MLTRRRFLQALFAAPVVITAANMVGLPSGILIPSSEPLILPDMDIIVPAITEASDLVFGYMIRPPVDAEFTFMVLQRDHGHYAPEHPALVLRAHAGDGDFVRFVYRGAFDGSINGKTYDRLMTIPAFV